MSTFVPIPEGADAEIRLTLFARPCELTLHFRSITGVVDTANLTALAVRLGLWFSSQVLPHLSSQLEFRETAVFDATVAGGPSFIDVTGAGFGGQEITSFSAMVAAVIAFIPASVPNVQANRNYLVGLPKGTVVGNDLSPAFMTAMRTAYINLIDIAPLAGYRWVCVHRFAGFTPLAEALTARVVTATFLRRTAGQRRKRVHNSF